MGFILSFLLWYVVYLWSMLCVGIVTSLVDVRLGVRTLYIRLLMLLFECGAKFAAGYEEEERDTLESEPDKSPKDIVRSKKDHGLIHREALEALKKKLADIPDANAERSYMKLMCEDVVDYTRAGFEAVVEDEVTSSFTIEEIPCWNLLSRTKAAYITFNWRLRVLWILGFLFRYILVVPVRALILVFGLGFLGASSVLVSRLPERHRRGVGGYLTLASFRMLAKSCSLRATFHNLEYRNKIKGGICVANHTSPIDVIVLGTKHLYSLTGQKHGGMLGFMERSLASVVPHVWFDRSDREARNKVMDALRNHAEDHSKPPILLFPEGVCVNNTSVMQFRKGAFEAGDKVYPIAMRYDAKFGDPFWSDTEWWEHVWGMLTSWAIICEIWYLPVMTRLPNESSVFFADRVKAAISEAAGLKFLAWDGFLKQYTVKQQQKDEEQKRYSQRLQKHLPDNEDNPADDPLSLS